MWAKQSTGGAKAWVSFNGSNCPSNWCQIYAGQNVTGAWRSGAGFYTIYFSTALSTNNYAPIITSKQNSAGLGSVGYPVALSTGNASFQFVNVDNPSPAARDQEFVSIVIFGT